MGKILTFRMKTSKTLLAISIVLMFDAAALASENRKFTRAHIHVSVSNGTDGTVTEHHVLGRYGLRSLTVPVSGTLVHVQTVDEARHGCSQYNHSLPSHDWIALIERGRCMFTDKIRIAAKQFNASGVIVYNNQGATDTPIIMSRIEDEVYVFVSKNDGRRLALMVDNGAHVHVQITPGDVNSSAWYRWSSGVSFLLVCIAVFLLSLG